MKKETKKQQAVLRVQRWLNKASEVSACRLIMSQFSELSEDSLNKMTINQLEVLSASIALGFNYGAEHSRNHWAPKYHAQVALVERLQGNQPVQYGQLKLVQGGN